MKLYEFYAKWILHLMPFLFIWWLYFYIQSLSHIDIFIYSADVAIFVTLIAAVGFICSGIEYYKLNKNRFSLNNNPGFLHRTKVFCFKKGIFILVFIGFAIALLLFILFIVNLFETTVTIKPDEIQGHPRFHEAVRQLISNLGVINSLYCVFIIFFLGELFFISSNRRKYDEALTHQMQGLNPNPNFQIPQ